MLGVHVPGAAAAATFEFVGKPIFGETFRHSKKGPVSFGEVLTSGSGNRVHRP